MIVVTLLSLAQCISLLIYINKGIRVDGLELLWGGSAYVHLIIALEISPLGLTVEPCDGLWCRSLKLLAFYGDGARGGPHLLALHLE